MSCVKRVRKLSIRDYYGFLKTLCLLNLGILPNILFFYFKCLDPVKKYNGWSSQQYWKVLIRFLFFEWVDNLLSGTFFKILLGEASKLQNIYSFVIFEILGVLKNKGKIFIFAWLKFILRFFIRYLRMNIGL